ncbi:J domain-containing protein [Pseudoalteromonas sp. GutCa3]|uniref:J domain-containing protein n=1 Tax=Pseudoalteromonas sp. GutCa3 TaxID=888433 RepID=UPI000C3233E2|nr:J domain-containing protein [Pseudoalteromonas sp. GutCa3]PKG68683.1 hypothetical protein CXF64_20390 [Pseudoalteromonas sp. GutCa3]
MKINIAINVLEKAANSKAVNFKSLKDIYKLAALKNHPDRKQGELSEFSMVEINKAWEFVSSKAAEVDRLIASKGTKQSFENQTSPIKDHDLTDSGLPAFFSRETLLNEAFTIVKDSKWNDWNNNKFETIYFEKYQVSVHIYSSVIIITNIKDALETGRKCTEYRINWGLDNDEIGMQRFYEWVRNINNDSCLTSVLANIYTADYKDINEYTCSAELAKGLKVTRSELKAVKVFSPFKLNKIKPLTEVKAKVSANHLIKIIANGQYCNLQRNYRYTDDYSYDSASNFGQKVFENPFKLLKELIEDRSQCFHVFKYNNGFSFGQHSNDGNSVIPSIENRFPSFDLIQSNNIAIQ